MTNPTTTLGADWIGSVSHGTMREQDLIPTFLDVLDEADPEKAADLRSAYEQMVDEDGTLDYDKLEEAGHLLHHLFDVLDEHAPEGTSFGAHEGDGADYGFFPYEDDFEEDEDGEEPNPYAGPGGLLDEVRQAERLIGTE